MANDKTPEVDPLPAGFEIDLTVKLFISRLGSLAQYTTDGVIDQCADDAAKVTKRLRERLASKASQ